MASQIDWKKLEDPSTVDSYLKSTQHIYVDEPIPSGSIRKYLEDICHFSKIKDWCLVKRRRIYKKYSDHGKKPLVNIRYDWYSTEFSAKLAVLQYSDDRTEHTIFVLESSHLTVIVGNNEGYTYIESPLFGYSSTKGNVDLIEPLVGYELSATQVFYSLLYYFTVYAHHSGK